MRLMIVATSVNLFLAAQGLSLNPIHAHAANVEIFISADDRFDLYTGTGGGTIDFVGGELSWPTVGHYDVDVPTGNYLYAVAADEFEGAWGLGGYVSLDGGASYNPILPTSGWEAALIGYNVAWPEQSTVGSWIVAANNNGDWVPAFVGTASQGGGLPYEYLDPSRPAVASIWYPGAVSQPYSTVLFRVSSAVLGRNLGDFNGDGSVDAADYVIWRDGLDTTYTQYDYDNVWLPHFGEIVPTGAAAFATSAVPEPATVVLMEAGIAFFFAVANRRAAYC